MKLSDLISVLNGVMAAHGDLECFTQDGCDPSDYGPVSHVQVVKPEVLPMFCRPEGKGCLIE